MLNTEPDAVIFLIGGTSHCGKSTLAELLSATIHAKLLSTDSLARHPGRPWKQPPEVLPRHVAEHYTSLSADELVASVYVHYEKLWPSIYSIIASHLQTSARLVIEGSALLPQAVHTLKHERIVAVWLYASADFLVKRIHTSSNYQEKTTYEQQLINKFIERTLAFNEVLMKQAAVLNLRNIAVEDFPDTEALIKACLQNYTGY
jgi:2-phosphoglycerate kinase